MSRSSKKESTTLYDAITGKLDTEYATYRGLLVGSSGKIHARTFAAWLDAQPRLQLLAREDSQTYKKNRATVADSNACGFILNLALDGLVSLELAFWATEHLAMVPPSASWQEWQTDGFAFEDEDAGKYAGMAIERAFVAASLSPAFDRFAESAQAAYDAFCKGRAEARELFGGVL